MNPYNDPEPSHDSYGVPLDCIYCKKPIAAGESSDDNDELCMDCEPEYAATLGCAVSRRYALAIAAGLIAVAVTILMGYLYLRLMGRVDGAWLL